MGVSLVENLMRQGAGVTTFAKVRVDFAGPLYARECGEMVKVYIALFTYCVTRTVHLDLVRNLSMSSFLNCLRRFASRRGALTLIVSDNAKTFKAAQKAVKKLYESGKVRAYKRDNCVKWQFNLERAPWWGGFFERLVGLVKRCLRIRCWGMPSCHSKNC
jgi:hypothetical protein